MKNNLYFNLKKSILLYLAILISISSYATTYTVTNSNDLGAGSLRDAISNAVTGDQIIFDASTDGNPIILTSGEISISNGISIIGNGEIATIIDGNTSQRIFTVSSSNQVVMESLTIRNGLANAESAGIKIDFSGNLNINQVTLSDHIAAGGFFNHGAAITTQGILVATNTTFTRNSLGVSTSGNYGGAIYVNGGSTTLENCLFSENITNSELVRGGAICNNSATVIINECEFFNNGNNNDNTNGGAIYNAATMTINNSKIHDNIAGWGGGIFNSANLTIKNSIISGNETFYIGGAGLLSYQNSVLNMSNCLVSGNVSCGSGAGIYVFKCTSTITNTTSTGNHSRICGISGASYAAGLYQTQGSLTINNSIVWNNYAETLFSDYYNFAGMGNVTAQKTLLAGWAHGGFAGTESPVFIQSLTPSATPSNAGDFRLTCSNNLFVDQGDNNLNTATLDLSGLERISNNTVDIGCYEKPGTSNIVTNTMDDGRVDSFRFYTDYSCDGDSITFSPTINNIPIVLTKGQITLGKNLTITGNGTGNTIIDGNGSNRIFSIPSGTTQKLEHLTLRNGGGVSQGGAVYNSGYLILEDAILTANNIVHAGLVQGGGIYSDGSILMKESQVLYNSAISLSNAVRGAGIYSTSGSLNIEDSDVIGNFAFAQTDANGGGIYTYSGSLTVNNSSILDNDLSTTTNNALGGGLYINSNTNLDNVTIQGNYAEGQQYGRGGGIYYNASNSMRISNSLITGNRSSALSSNGGGVYYSSNSGSSVIYGSTISENRANGGSSEGGGLYNESNNSVSTYNSIIWSNHADNSTEAFGDFAYNNTLVRNSNEGGFSGNENPLFIAPNPGGNSSFSGGDFRLSATSPLVDAGDNNNNHGSVDVLGNPRLMDGDMNGSSVVDLGAIEFPDNTLPVEMAKFEARKKDNTSHLTWETVSEINNKGFFVEYSINGLEWEILDFVDGYGNSNIKRTYTYIHENPISGGNYYRLKQVDFDESASFSSIRLLFFNFNETEPIFPNPTRGNATFQYLSEGGELELQILNTEGKLVWTENTTLLKGNNEITLNLSSLTSGVYWIQLIEGNSMLSKQVLKIE